MARASRWPPEYQARAVALVRHRPVARVAKEPGVGEESLRAWVGQDEADRGERGDRPTSVESEELGPTEGLRLQL